MNSGDEAEIATRASIVRLGADGIVRVTFRAGVEVTLADGEAVMAAGTRLIAGKARPFLTDISKVRSIARPARVFFASEEVARNCLASAILVGSPVSRAIGNFFLGLNRPPFAVRLFTVESEALAWLGQLRASED